MMLRTLLACLLLFPGHVLAREAVVGMSERVFKAVAEIQAAIDAGEYSQANEHIDSLLQQRMTSYETAHTLNLQGYAWYEQDRLDKARLSYEAALAQPRLPDSMLANLLLTLGQVCLVLEDFDAAEANLRRLLGLRDQSTANNKVLLANALMGQQRYEEALAPLLQAIEASANTENAPRESWLSMLASAYYELQDFEQMRAVMERLATHYPREQYLMNLAALHGQLGDSGRQLALIEALADDDRLQQPVHIVMLANLFMSENLPYKAARLMQSAVDTERVAASTPNLELLSQAWLSSGDTERAVPPLQRAAELSDDGELYLRLASLHMDAYKWEAADQAAKAALAKGGLRREGHAWLLRGMARVRLEQFTAAREFLQRAQRHDDTQRYATQWLDWMEGESARLAAIDARST